MTAGALRVLVVGLACLALGGALGQRSPIGPAYGPVPVSLVRDGDTLVVASNVGPRTVRLIGVDAPETHHPDVGREPFGAEADAFLQGLLPEGTPVWLELDRGHEDDFGRLLAYVYVEDAEGGWQVDGVRVRQVNLALAEAGYARVMTIEPNAVYADLYREAVAAARAAGRGMWAAAGGPRVPVAGPSGDPTPADADPSLPPGPIVIACALYDPATPNDEDGEWVELLIREALDTRGYYVWDEGSRTGFALPAGEQPAGTLRIGNPDQGIWNNGGDTIYLMRGDVVVDAWDYRDARGPEGAVVCRGGR